MWDYTDKVLEHFKNPRNVGLIKDADGVGQVGSLACGDALKLSFKLDEEKERIADAKFQTFGCASAIASSSALTEIIKGMTLAEAEKVTNRDIAEFLGGLPEQKMHCSVLGKEALELAIRNYRTGETQQKELEGEVVCRCFGVTDLEIESVVRENDLKTIEEVTNYCKAGGACGACHDDIRAIIEKVRKTLQTQTAPKKQARLTTLQKIKLIEETIDREIRPKLQQDGGDLELIDVQDNRVIVSLRGMCAGCNVAQFTLRDVVESKLREFVAPEITVEEESA